jgi:hypothetical protein
MCFTYFNSFQIALTFRFFRTVFFWSRYTLNEDIRLSHLFNVRVIQRREIHTYHNYPWSGGDLNPRKGILATRTCRYGLVKVWGGMAGVPPSFVESLQLVTVFKPSRHCTLSWEFPCTCCPHNPYWKILLHNITPCPRHTVVLHEVFFIEVYPLKFCI